MEHIAIDLGGRESQVCIRCADNEILLERRVLTAKLGELLGRRPRSRVILETCAESFAVADWALEAGHEVRVVPAMLVKSLGVGQRGIKNDKRDAQVLSEVSCRIDLPSVHIPSAQAREMKALCGMREALIGARTKLINTVRGWFRGRTERIRPGSTPTFAERARATSSQIPSYVERQLVSIEQLTDQIRAADSDVRRLARESELATRLMTLPGVGPVTSLRFIAALDDARRFGDAHQVESYLGLTPGEHSSSDRKRRTGITKAGAPRLRWALVQAAWSARRSRLHGMDPMVRWSLQVEQRRGKRIAIVALARKMAGVLYAMWRDGTSYNPLRMMDDSRLNPPAMLTAAPAMGCGVLPVSA